MATGRSFSKTRPEPPHAPWRCHRDCRVSSGMSLSLPDRTRRSLEILTSTLKFGKRDKRKALDEIYNCFHHLRRHFLCGHAQRYVQLEMANHLAKSSIHSPVRYRCRPATDSANGDGFPNTRNRPIVQDGFQGRPPITPGVWCAFATTPRGNCLSYRILKQSLIRNAYKQPCPLGWVALAGRQDRKVPM